MFFLLKIDNDHCCDLRYIGLFFRKVIKSLMFCCMFASNCSTTVCAYSLLAPTTVSDWVYFFVAFREDFFVFREDFLPFVVFLP